MFRFLRRFLKEEEDPQVRLRKKFVHFRHLLESNNQALAIMADMEEKLSGDFLFDTGYLNIQVEQLGNHVCRMAEELNTLTQDRYPELALIYQQLKREIQQELAEVPEIPETPYVLPLAVLSRESAAAVGAKMANLGEIRSRLGLAVPEGFGITATAYKRFLEASGLAAELENRLAQARIADLESLRAISRELQALVRLAPLPPDLEAVLLEAAEAMPGHRLAVRSSAVGEDTEFSFAGQFATLLNVDAADLPSHYKEIVASKFTARAIFYWKYQNFSINELPMAVGCLAMVPARASGVLFSLDPHAPETNTLIITAVWGLGKYAVDGTITPDLYVVERSGGHLLKQLRVANKPVALTCRPDGGCAEVALEPEQAQAPCLTPEQIQTLADIALRLEKHFSHPQDIEWCLDEAGNFVILQSRPLRVSTAVFGEAPREPAREPVPPLLHYGIRAVGGVAAGPVFLFLKDEQVTAIPEGAVVVARQPSARLVLVMDRINAIITEMGSPTDHMTILAREFRIPTLVEVGGATRVLYPGQMVTVDADAARVYPGIVLEVLERRVQAEEEAWRDNPVFHKLRLVLKKTAPLNLLDPTSPEFQAGHCRTLHDITRFCHEKAMDTMFALDVEEAIEASGVCRLKTDLPLNLFILDLGGGLAVSGQSLVEEQDILSRPFKALLRGFHHPRVSWAGQVAPDLRGFMSVLANTMYDIGKAERGLGGKSFAIVSDSYLNFNSRLGYHFGLVDSFISEEQNDNYISFQFKGGAASIERRERRARLLSQLLDDLGFKVQVKGDLVQGRLVKYSLLETEETLELVGLLMAFCRQLDLALASEAVAERCLQAFRKEDYSLSCLRPEQAAS
jgi:pyruvate,water dikinase